jgi:hypothetical protein
MLPAVNHHQIRLSKCAEPRGTEACLWIVSRTIDSIVCWLLCLYGELNGTLWCYVAGLIWSVPGRILFFLRPVWTYDSRSAVEVNSSNAMWRCSALKMEATHSCEVLVPLPLAVLNHMPVDRNFSIQCVRNSNIKTRYCLSTGMRCGVQPFRNCQWYILSLQGSESYFEFQYGSESLQRCLVLFSVCRVCAVTCWRFAVISYLCKCVKCQGGWIS